MKKSLSLDTQRAVWLRCSQTALFEKHECLQAFSASAIIPTHALKP